MVEITHENLNDRTVKGLRHKDLPLFTVQYLPEAAPSPRGASNLFHRFREMVSQRRRCASFVITLAARGESALQASGTNEKKPLIVLRDVAPARLPQRERHTRNETLRGEDR